MIKSIKRIEISPSNRASSSNGETVYSYRNGTTSMIFNIGVQDHYLLPEKMSLSFKVRVFTGLGAGQRPDNNEQDGNAGRDCKINPMIGAASFFQNIYISNQQNNQSLESVRNYPRLLCSTLPSQTDFNDYVGTNMYQFMATSNVESTGMMCNADYEVSMPILAGMFLMREPIPLGEGGRGCGGLQLEFQLANSVDCLWGANAASGYYEIVNPTLRCSLGVPDTQDGLLPKIEALPYLCYSSYYNTINTSDEQINYNLGLSSVLSIFNNSIPSRWLANSLVDSCRTPPFLNDTLPTGNGSVVAPVKRYTTLRGGVRFPQLFATNEERNITTVGGLQVASFEAQLTRNYINSIVIEPKQTLIGPISEDTLSAPFSPAPPTVASLLANNFNTPGSSSNGGDNTLSGGYLYGTGVKYDAMGVGSGANFKNRTFSQRYETTLSGNDPQSLYTFALHRNMINFAPQGGIAVAN